MSITLGLRPEFRECAGGSGERVGGGKADVAHTLEEKISKRELLAAVDTYARITRMLQGRADTQYG